MTTIEASGKLDNPVWFSLTEVHKTFGIDYKSIKFYHPDYCPFGGFINSVDRITDAIDNYAGLTDNFFIVGEKPLLSKQLTIAKELVCLQMVIDHEIVSPGPDEIRKLTTTDAGALFGLVNLVQPGYFRPGTMVLGHYYGIFKKDGLVAVTGERMKMSGYTEVSAVVTHPAHTGRGFAMQLVAHAVTEMLTQNEMPFLQVAENNARAINLYHRAGFRVRRKISFWNITKVAGVVL